jgi:hypothetical protein
VVGDEFHVNPKEVLDADAFIGPPDDPIPVRIVGVPTTKGYCMFITNIPRETHNGVDVGTLYRLRWCIELDNKLSKSACRLDDLAAEKPVSALVLVHAAMIASIVANALTFSENTRRGASLKKHVRVAPLHPMAVAKMVASMAERLAGLMADSSANRLAWNRAADNIVHMGRDPNWRRSPSVLDIVKGRVAKGWHQGQSSGNIDAVVAETR